MLNVSNYSEFKRLLEAGTWSYSGYLGQLQGTKDCATCLYTVANDGALVLV